MDDFHALSGDRYTYILKLDSSITKLFSLRFMEQQK